MGEDISTGAKIGVSLILLCSLIAMPLSILMVLKSGTADLQSAVLAAPAAPIDWEAVKRTAITAVSCVAAAVLLAIANHFGHIRERLYHRWLCANRRGMYADWRTAQGSMEMTCDTFYALFTENPEKYRVGHYKSRYIPTILYNSNWQTPVEENFVEVGDLPDKKCVQIRLPYKEQKKLLGFLAGTIYDPEYRESLAETKEELTRNTYSALAALEMRKDLGEVISAQNAANAVAAEECAKIATRITG